MFAGMEIKLGNEKLIVPPLSLGQLRNGTLELLRKHDELLAENKTFEAMEYRGQVILKALRRNYPDYTEELLFDQLDMVNTGDIWLYILGASGFAPGEKVAVSQATDGT